MSDVVDDELLGGEDEIDDIYDITNEREEALLQEEDEYSKSRDGYDNRKKSESYSENEEPDDVLNLDVEEDFQDDDKLLYDDEEEEESHKKIETQVSVEKPQSLKQNMTSGTNTTAKTVQMAKTSAPQAKKPYTGPQKFSGNNNAMQSDKRKRGNGQRNFQTRSNFVKNKMQRRRNGTVLINPRYEGTVHVNENEARLAWKNPQYSQNNTSFVQPWNSENMLRNCDLNLQSQLLVSNLVNGIANGFAQTPGNMLMPQSQPQTQHFYKPPTNNYEQPLSYEPPPNLVEDQHLYHSQSNQNQDVSGWNNRYNEFSQVTNQIHHPPVQQSYSRQIEQQPYNSQLSMNRPQGNSKPYNSSYSNYNRYNRTNNQNMGPTKNSNIVNSYEGNNLNYNKYNTRPSMYSNNYYPPQTGDNYERKNLNYSNYPPKQENYNNYNSGNYETRNDVLARSDNLNYYKQEVQQNQAYSNKDQCQNRPIQQGQFRRRENTYIPNKNFKQGNRRPINNTECTDFREELPEKKVKMTENNPQSTEVSEETEVSSTEQTHPVSVNVINNTEEQEDEETRLYRLKIEEQKRERERILRIKEERRKQMMLQRQKEEEQKLLIPGSEGFKQNPLKQNLQNNNTNNQSIKRDMVEHAVGTIPVQKINRLTSGSVPNVIQRLGKVPQRQLSRQNQNSTLSSIPSNYPQQTTNYSDNSNSDLPPEFPNLTFKVSNDRQSNVPIKDLPKKMPNLTFKVTNNLQSNAPVAKELPKAEASSSGFMSNRVVVVKSKTKASNEVLTNSDVNKQVCNEASSESSDTGQGLSSFFNNRKVLKKDNNLLNTKLVVVNNLSATINQNKLMALSQGIGEIQQLRVDKQERQATILFKSVASAHAFYKKYQRRILDDLSVIEVKLEPML
ncbi:homeobox protein 5-like isoform X3 [Zophobas morio]|uniref:homeobox protein 5-like isoform X3 n=1 Tax=Zophobas morio TaxID=2755281 RepID=UPI0030834AE3